MLAATVALIGALSLAIRRRHDVWLAAGESVRLAGRGLAIVEAVDGSAVRITRGGA